MLIKWSCNPCVPKGHPAIKTGLQMSTTTSPTSRKPKSFCKGTTAKPTKESVCRTLTLLPLPSAWIHCLFLRSLLMKEKCWNCSCRYIFKLCSLEVFSYFKLLEQWGFHHLPCKIISMSFPHMAFSFSPLYRLIQYLIMFINIMYCCNNSYLVLFSANPDFACFELVVINVLWFFIFFFVLHTVSKMVISSL